MNSKPLFAVLTFVSTTLTTFAAATTPLPADLQLVPSDALPAQATWFSFQRWGTRPPVPANWCAGRTDVLYYRSPSFGTNKIIIDDSLVDYSQAQAATASSDGPPMPEGGGGTGGGGGTPGPLGPVYGPNDFWLELAFDTNNIGLLQPILHATTNGFYYELLTKTALGDPALSWKPIETKLDSNATNELWFTEVPYTNPPILFFRAVGAPNKATMDIIQNHAIEPDASGNGAQNGLLQISLSEANSSDITVAYALSGTATYGLDYSNFPGTVTAALGTVTIPALAQSVFVNLQPFHDPQVDFDETAVFRLVPTNGYVVDPAHSSVTIRISDNFGPTNLFEIVATNVPSPVDIDYHPPTHSLLLSVNFQIPDATNFALLDTNSTLRFWSPVQGVGTGKEIKVATIKATVNGFTNGDLFFDNGTPGGIGWVSSDGVTFNTNWAANSQLATNEPDVLGGDLYADQTGVWGNDLLAVTGDETALSDTRGVWRIHSATNATLVARIPTQHLEGILTLPNDPQRYGPWAGKLLTGDDIFGLIYAVDTNGVVATYNLGIAPDTIRLIPPNQDLYCVDFKNFHQDQSMILKVARQWFSAFTDDVLMVQAGENGPQAPILFIVHWSGTAFEVHSIALHDYRPDENELFEKAAFAPVSLPPVAQ